MLFSKMLVRLYLTKWNINKYALKYDHFKTFYKEANVSAMGLSIEDESFTVEGDKNDNNDRKLINYHIYHFLRNCRLYPY